MPLKYGDLEPIRESDYFKTFDGDTLGSKFVLCDRLSTDTQADNAGIRKPFLFYEALKVKSQVVEYCCETVSGRPCCLCQRWEHKKAFEIALKENASIVFLCVNRIIRPEDFRYKTNPFVPLRERDMKRWLQWLERNFGQDATRIKVMTILPPDTPAKEQQHFLSRLGQIGKDNLGGRPVKCRKEPGELAARKGVFHPIVIALHQEGLPMKKIPQKIVDKFDVKIPQGTVAYWIREWKNREATEHGAR